MPAEHDPNTYTLPPIDPAVAASDRVFVGFSTTSAPLSRAVRYFTKAAYSHAWLCHGSDLWGGAWVTQANLPRVHPWPYEVATKDWTRAMVYEVIAPFRASMLQGMGRSRGDFEERFDVLGLVGSGLRIVEHQLRHLPAKNRLALPHELFCSEFVADVLKATQDAAFAHYDPPNSTPAEIFNACGRHHLLFRRYERDEFARWLTEVGSKGDPALIHGRSEWKFEQQPE